MKAGIFTLLITLSIALCLTGCATAPAPSEAVAVPEDSALSMAQPITVSGKPITRMCLYSGRIFTQTADGQRTYL